MVRSSLLNSANTYSSCSCILFNSSCVNSRGGGGGAFGKIFFSFSIDVSVFGGFNPIILFVILLLMGIKLTGGSFLISSIIFLKNSFISFCIV